VVGAAPAERQSYQVGQGLLGASSRQTSGEEQAPQDWRHFKVDEFRSGQEIAPKTRPGMVTVDPVVGESRGENASINDDHGPPATLSSLRRTAPTRRPDHRPGPERPPLSGWLPPRSAARAGTP